MDLNFEKPPKPVKCRHCGHPKQKHKAGTYHCPMGTAHRVIGFTSYSLTQQFEPKEAKEPKKPKKQTPGTTSPATSSTIRSTKEKTMKETLKITGNSHKLLLPSGQEHNVEIPSKPQTFDQFKRSWGQLYCKPEKFEVPTFIPCHNPDCRGRGWIYDPNDQPCPVEGNKMRTRLKCTDCNGSGNGDKKKLMAIYKAEVEQKNNRRAEKIGQIIAANQTLVRFKKLLSVKDWLNLKAIGIIR
jgi:hypothetical protein